MTRTRLRRLATAGARAALILGAAPALADGPPPTAAIRPPSAESRQPVPTRTPRRDPADSTPGSGGWWVWPAGIAATLAAFGGVSRASKRFLPSRDSGPIRVVGRAALSPRQSVYLVRVGDRVLIVGAGTQGAPAILGEVTDPAELTRLAPRRPVVGPSRPSPGFDRRIGDDA